jgi:hypothetical protein
VSRWYHGCSSAEETARQRNAEGIRKPWQRQFPAVAAGAGTWAKRIRARQRWLQLYKDMGYGVLFVADDPRGIPK